MRALIPRERIEQAILVIRGHRVMLDADLAELYGVETKAFNRAVARNMERFPDEFMFRLNKNEYEDLRYHFGTSRWGGRRYLPYVFTEQGVAMLSSVLRSKRAIQVNIGIMRAFVQLRGMIVSNKGLARRFNELEKRYDGQFRIVFEAIRELMAEAESKSQRIGFKT